MVDFNTWLLGDNCIQNFHLGRCMVGYTVRYLVLRQHGSKAVKHDFPRYIRRCTFPNENFEYGYPHFNALLQNLRLASCIKPHKGSALEYIRTLAKSAKRKFNFLFSQPKYMLWVLKKLNETVLLRTQNLC